MQMSEMFSKAQWVCAGVYSGETQTVKDGGGVPHFPVLRRRFTVGKVQKAVLKIVGLGFFHGYINGKNITEDEFLPLNTDFQPRKNYPPEEIMTGHRLLVPQYDVTGLLQEGENVLAIHFGGGWYTFDEARFGNAQAIWELEVTTEQGTEILGSGVEDKIGSSFVDTYYFTMYENHDYTGWCDETFALNFDDSGWKNAVPGPGLSEKTVYDFSDCPADRKEELRPFTKMGEKNGVAAYDSGINTACLPVIKLTGSKGDKVTLWFSEEVDRDGWPDLMFGYDQKMEIVCDGRERLVRPQFTWFAFRYMLVEGKAEVVGFHRVHTDTAITADFTCNDDTLNWLWKTYLNTQHSNMHAGIPSDCPHIERRGYTGDGQLTCHAVMNAMDAKEFYKKWIDDISDCQDIVTGHVQYTAPYTRCGGGPGGWGCAIAEVPYQYWLHYGDDEPMIRLYPQMLRYFDFLEAHSENELVVSDKKGQWCLGDWCTTEWVLLPAAFVNNYFYVKTLGRAMVAAKHAGREEDIPMLHQRMEIKKKAMMAAFYNTWDGNFFGSRQGANGFAAEIGIGDERTYENLVKFYEKATGFDTGIFGTDILIRLLFERGDGKLALKMLTSKDMKSFDGMRQKGASTLWEYWPEEEGDRSHDHPMFGAACSALHDYILGILPATEENPGYSSVTVRPEVDCGLTFAKGYRTLPAGKVSVDWEKVGEFVTVKVCLPESLPGTLLLHGKEYPLHAGENSITVTE